MRQRGGEVGGGRGRGGHKKLSKKTLKTVNIPFNSLFLKPVILIVVNLFSVFNFTQNGSLRV